ncbi:MAG: ribosome maturation factor RimP [Propionibacteriaceae bacterium]|nr:ribosome maturation factor RimP [Propionibacteriaceae bacterium]
MNDSQLTSLLSPLLAQFALELESLDSVPAGRRRLLRVIVDGDGPEGRGPSLDDIAEATKAISTALDEADLVGDQAYTLEVSSRGTSRPLTQPKHWRRNRDRLVKAILADGGEVTGRVLRSDDSGATLEVVTDQKKNITAERELAFADITKALVQVELNRKSADPGEEGDL